MPTPFGVNNLLKFLMTKWNFADFEIQESKVDVQILYVINLFRLCHKHVIFGFMPQNYEFILKLQRKRMNFCWKTSTDVIEKFFSFSSSYFLFLSYSGEFSFTLQGGGLCSKPLNLCSRALNMCPRALYSSFKPLNIKIIGGEGILWRCSKKNTGCEKM